MESLLVDWRGDGKIDIANSAGVELVQSSTMVHNRDRKGLECKNKHVVASGDDYL